MAWSRTLYLGSFCNNVKAASTVVSGLCLYLIYASVVKKGSTHLPIRTCHIPELIPGDPSILEFVGKPEEDLNCGHNHTRYFTTDTEGNLIQLQDPTKHGFLSCCYRKFQRKSGSEMEIVKSTVCKRISRNVTEVPKNYEFIMVECLANNTSGTSYKTVDMFGFVPLKSTDSIQDFSDNLELTKRKKVNVVVLGIDGVSHMNFLRRFNSSYNYLTRNLSAFGMGGYNKVAGSTFPNILPVLSGLSEIELLEENGDVSKMFFDQVPFIWKKFSQDGYRTAFSEDAVHIGIFHHEKRGFRDPLTDYYHHTLLQAMDREIGHTPQNGVSNLCYGSRLSFELLLDLMKKMAATMNKAKPYFHFTWATSLTHNRLNHGQFGDQLLLKALQWFKTGGYLNDTILILMSDHGARTGKIRLTLQGKYENRMPFLYFVIPEWFQEKYSRAVRNMNANKLLLTTHFDLHETLMDLLHLVNIENPVLRERESQLEDSVKLPRGISLFLPIPPRRTCEDAGLSIHWCVCGKAEPVVLEGNEVVVAGAREAVDVLNRKLSQFPQCLKLVFELVLDAQVLRSSHESGDHDDWNNNVVQPIRYNIGFRVQPSGGTFEATVTHFDNGSLAVSGDISRTNIYGLQSRCIHDYGLKKYCYCG